MTHRIFLAHLLRVTHRSLPAVFSSVTTDCAVAATLRFFFFEDETMGGFVNNNNNNNDKNGCLW